MNLTGKFTLDAGPGLCVVAAPSRLTLLVVLLRIQDPSDPISSHHNSAMKFSDYATPQSSLKYSQEYFASLTFERSQSIDYPTIANPGFITGWCFDSTEPRTAAGTVVQPGEVVPHAQDLLPISRAMEGAYMAGSRSVVVNLGELQVAYHFSKVRCSCFSLGNLLNLWLPDSSSSCYKQQLCSYHERPLPL